MLRIAFPMSAPQVAPRRQPPNCAEHPEFVPLMGRNSPFTLGSCHESMKVSAHSRTLTASCDTLSNLAGQHIPS
jgi:hypothetical protein